MKMEIVSKQLCSTLFIVLSTAFLCSAADVKQSAYPTKLSPVVGDRALIVDSADGNRTKNVNLGSLPVATATQTALNLKADASAFASQSAFTAAWGWTPGGISAWSDVQALISGTGDYIKYDGTRGTPVGTLPPGTEGQTIQYGSGGTPGAVNLAPLAFTDNVSRNTTTGVVSVPVTATATSGSAVPLTSGGAYTALAGKQDTLVSGTSIKTINSTSLLGDGNIDIAGGTGGYVSLSDAPYSDVACTTGQYGYYGSTAYLCTDGFWTSKWTLTTHSNAAPVGCAGGSDGYIGYATFGNDDADGTANLLYYSYFTPTEDGTFTYAHAMKLYSGTYQIGLFSSSGELLASTGAQTGGSDPIAAINVAIEPYCLVAGTTYIVGIWRPAGWSSIGTSAYLGAPNNVYTQVLGTFGSFTPADTVKVPDKALTITLNNSASTF